ARDRGAQRRLVGDRVLGARDGVQELSLPVGEREVVPDEVIGGEGRELPLHHRDRRVETVRARGDRYSVDPAEDDLEAALLAREQRNRRRARRVGGRVGIVLVVVRFALPDEAGEIGDQELQALGG